MTVLEIDNVTKTPVADAPPREEAAPPEEAVAPESQSSKESTSRRSSRNWCCREGDERPPAHDPNSYSRRKQIP